MYINITQLVFFINTEKFNKIGYYRNNIYMNQILVNKKSNKKIKYIFKVQFIISIVIIAILLFILNYNDKENLEEISTEINKAVKLSSIYKIENKSDMYFGKIIIDKIGLEYPIFNEFSEELLRIAPCKFYGESVEHKGNIAIVGHNYNDNRFFRKIIRTRN